MAPTDRLAETKNPPAFKRCGCCGAAPQPVLAAAAAADGPRPEGDLASRAAVSGVDESGVGPAGDTAAGAGRAWLLAIRPALAGGDAAAVAFGDAGRLGATTAVAVAVGAAVTAGTAIASGYDVETTTGVVARTAVTAIPRTASSAIERIISLIP